MTKDGIKITTLIILTAFIGLGMFFAFPLMAISAEENMTNTDQNTTNTDQNTTALDSGVVSGAIRGTS